MKSADYERYLSFRRRMDGGEVLTGRDVEELEQLIQSSPGLTDARFLAASAAALLKDRPRADRILQGGRMPATTMTRGWPTSASCSSSRPGTVADAQEALGRVREAGARRRPRVAGTGPAPGPSGQAPAKRSRCCGRLLRERPSWTNLWYIADVEIDLGDAQGAREHLRQLLEVSPRNPRGRAKLAELEWFLGDPAKAARIYEELLKEHETRENVSNLGWSLLLAGEYAAAAARLSSGPSRWSRRTC